MTMMIEWVGRFRNRHVIGSRWLCSGNVSVDNAPRPSFGPPPILPQRRVVVTGLGMVTPLGSGVEASWQRLIDGGCGVRALCAEDLKMDGFEKATMLHTLQQLPSQVVAAVPCGTNPVLSHSNSSMSPEPWPSTPEDIFTHMKSLCAEIKVFAVEEILGTNVVGTLVPLHTPSCEAPVTRLIFAPKDRVNDLYQSRDCVGKDIIGRFRSYSKIVPSCTAGHTPVRSWYMNFSKPKTMEKKGDVLSYLPTVASKENKAVRLRN
eukprot:Gb_05560 [translate_table: standard]